MTSKASCSNRLMLRQGLHRNLWAIMLSVVVFGLATLLPGVMMMQTSLRTLHMAQPEELSALAVDLQVILCSALTKTGLIVLAVICGTALFRYLHNRQTVDFYHALPVSRGRLFAVHYLTGLLCVLPIYYVMQALLTGAAYAMGLGALVDLRYVAVCLVVNTLFFVLLYTIVVLCTLLCGNTIVSLLLSGWALLSPAMAVYLVRQLFERFFLTFVAGEGWMTVLQTITPAIRFFTVNGLQLSGDSAATSAAEQAVSAVPLLLFYAFVSAGLIALSYVLFLRRKSEMAGTALAFPRLQLPLKWYICLVSGVVVAFLFDAFAASNLWFWIGAGIGVLLLHVVIEIVYAFDLHAGLRHPLQAVMILTMLLLGLGTMQFDIYGYDAWIPAADRVAGVRIIDGWYDDGRENSAMLRTQDSIAAAQAIAQIGVQQAAGKDEVAWDQQGCIVAYEMTNGRVKKRQYTLPIDSASDEALRRFTGSDAYKKANYGVFRFTASDYDAPYLYLENAANNQARITDVDIIVELQTVLQQETLKRTARAKPVMALTFGESSTDAQGQQTIYHDLAAAVVSDEDTETLRLIAHYTGIAPEPIRADQVQSVRLEYRSANDLAAGGDLALVEPYAYAADMTYQSATVTDPADIAALLENATPHDLMNANFKSYGDFAIIGGFTEYGAFRMVDADGGIYFQAEATAEGYTQTSLAYPNGEAPVTLYEKYRAQAK